MSCYNLMVAVKTDELTKNNKPRYRFLSSFAKNYSPMVESELRAYGEMQWYGYSDKIDGKPRFIVDPDTGEVLNRAILLPCGQCLGCRLSHAASWADRILLEAQYHDQSYFVTLTYDDAHVPVSQSQDGIDNLTLDPKDLQDFIKRLRYYCDYHGLPPIRTYQVGEYGSQFKRPHYHLILFGFSPPDGDIKEIGRNKRKAMLHSSSIIEQCWSFPARRDMLDVRSGSLIRAGDHSLAGRVQVDRMTWEAAAYCARYCVKKLGKREDDFYKVNNIVPEFQRMSNRPAIGAQYYDDNKERIYKSDRISIPVADGARQVMPPRYYDKLFDAEYPDQMAAVKQQRREIARQAIKFKMSNFSGSYLELLHNEELRLKEKTKTLRRNIE